MRLEQNSPQAVILHKRPLKYRVTKKIPIDQSMGNSDSYVGNFRKLISKKSCPNMKVLYIK